MPIDRVPFYTNEQFATDDLTALERVVESALEDVVGFGLHSPLLQVPFGTTPSAALLGGLEAAASGGSLVIGPGALILSDTAPDNPSRSSRYLAFSEGGTVPMPTPVVDTWYIVTARPQLANDAPVQRRVWDVDNARWQNPSPSLVKRRRATMLFEVQTSAIAGQLGLVLPTGTVPLWGVFRPAGGGALGTPVDLRPQQARGGRSTGDNTGAHYRQNAWVYTPLTGLRLNCHAELDEHELHAHGTNLNPLDYKDPTSSAPADGEWWYLYLSPFKALGPLVAPRAAQAGSTDLAQQGLLVFSQIPPYARDSNYARRNSAAITAPLPFNGATIADADAILIATLKRVSGAWLSAQGDGDWTQLPTQPSTYVASSTMEFSFTPDAPLGARALSYEIGFAPDSTGLSTQIQIRDGATIFWRSFSTVDPDGTQGSKDMTGEFGIAALPAGQPLTVTGTVAKTWNLRIKGYRI